MRWFLFLLINTITLLFKLTQSGGVKAVISENLLLKHQLLIAGRSRQRAPTLNPLDRFILGWLAILLNPGRIMKAAIIIKPSTLLAFHLALVRGKYQHLFGSVHKGKPGPNGPNKKLINIILELKQRNPEYGCLKIALLLSNRFGIEINKDVVRRILAMHYKPGTNNHNGPSWLSLIGNMKDSLWSIDLFRCESITLNSHWVLVVMDQWSRRIIGFGIQGGPVNGPALCRMFNQAISKTRTPKYISTDHDPLFKFHRWQANLRILDIKEIKSVPYTPVSHPFVERLIGTIRREYLDQTFFWNSADLERKLNHFKDYYNQYRVHSSLNGDAPSEHCGEILRKLINLDRYTWRSHCAGLFQTPIVA